MDELNNASDFLLLILTAMLAIFVMRFVVPAVLIALYYVLLATYELLVLVPFKWLSKWLRRNRWPKPQPRPLFQRGPHFYGSRKIGEPVTVKRPVSFRVYKEASNPRLDVLFGEQRIGNAKYNQPEPDALWDGELKQC